MDNIIETLANLFAENLIIPFFGAGASKSHLNVDWNSIGTEMDSMTGITSDNNIEAAQNFKSKFGKKELCNFLRQRLILNEFHDEKGNIYLFLLSMNCYFYYTTNQDNVFELCLKKYKKEYNLLSDISTFKEYKPNRITIYKFHGHLDYPETVVFTNDDYQQRMLLTNKLSTYNPLDIKLLSDSISKNLFFIGYSFRDPNTMEMFEHINKVFKGNIPQSYLIEYEHDSDFEKILRERFNIECINPIEHFPDQSLDSAFNSFLSLVAKTAVEKSTSNEQEYLLGYGDKYGVIPSVSNFDIEKFSSYQLSTNDSITDQIEKFRQLFDLKTIPIDSQNKFTEIILRLIETIESKDDAANIAGFFPWMSNIEPKNSLEILTHYFYSLRRIKSSDTLESIALLNVHVESIPSSTNIYCLARAFELIIQNENKVPDSFLQIVCSSIHSKSEIENLPNEIQQYISNQFGKAFQGNRNYRNPLSIDFKGFKSVSYEEIQKKIDSFFPKKNKNTPI